MADDNSTPVFQIQRMYLKDLSLEQPNAPQILLEQAQPQVDIKLSLAAEPIADTQGRLEIHAGARYEASKVGQGERFRTDVEFKRGAIAAKDRQAAAVHGDGGPEPGTLQDSGGADAQSATVAGLHPAQFLHNSREHNGVETNPGGVGSHWWFS